MKIHKISAEHITPRQAQIGMGLVMAVSFLTNWLSVALNWAAASIQALVLRPFM